MAITPVHTLLTVTAAGTAEQCTSDTDIKPSSIYFEADKDNTGDIYIGVSDVDSDEYITKLEAGEGFSFDPDAEVMNSSRDEANFQLSDFYVDSSVSGEKVQMTYQGRKEK